MIPKQPLGLTGHASTRLIFGSWALRQATQADADQILKLLVEYGINHIDTAPMYGNAEELMGSWMSQHRQRFFLATKSRRRTYEAAWADLRRSLKRLQVDYVDLWQMHGLTNAAGWAKAMGDGGAFQAFLEARDQGLVRFLGVTGHGLKAPAMHLRSLEHTAFDSVQLPYNHRLMQNPKYASATDALFTLCRQRQVAVQTIKAIARWPRRGGSENYNTYFYEPLDTQPAIDKAVHWVLGNPDLFLITAGDMELLPMVLDAAVRFQSRPSDPVMDAHAHEHDIQPIWS